MFCRYCAAKLVDGAAFCHECGKATYDQPVVQAVPVQPVQQPVPVQVVYPQPVAPAQPAYQVPVFQQTQYRYTVPPVSGDPVKPAADPAQLEKLEKQALTFGILSLSLSMLGVPGIVFGGLASGRAGTYKKLTGGLSGKVRTGYRLAKAGRIVGIVMTVLLAIIVPTLLENAAYNDFDYSQPFGYFDYY